MVRLAPAAEGARVVGGGRGPGYMAAMATLPDDHPPEMPLDLKEQIARIDKMQAELQKLMRETLKITQDTRLATPQTFFQGAIAMAALIGAGVALAKLVF